MEQETLPTLNAILNGTAATLLVAARLAIRRKNIAQHRSLMIAVVVVSALFLTSYLIYHVSYGSRPFQGEGGVRVVYFAILLSHTVLAAALLPLVLITLRRGLKRMDEAHKAIARWTFPIWLYVSVTGVIIYLMLYQLFPG